MKFLWIAFILFVIHEGTCDGVCTEPGRFPNNTRDDCRGYVMCLKGATSITHYNLVCPEQSIYSHIDNHCTNVTSYQCHPSYTCLQEGDFANDSDENCSTYVSCVQDLGRIVSARLITCPTDMVFSATDGVCVNSTSYKCIREAPKVDEVSVHDTDIRVTGIASSGPRMCISVSSFVISILLVSSQLPQ